jgi:hypothetical protein
VIGVTANKILNVGEMKKVSSGSRTEKPEKQSEAGAAKLMKPRIELNLSGRIGF